LPLDFGPRLFSRLRGGARDEEYFEDQDTVGQWIEDRANPQAGAFAFTLSSELFTS
jgi:phage/plasmid-associated DNA primase